jgi:GH15 family glucan-1,4-alpha-glucosidase
MSKPIEDYALISDCRSAGLIARDGSLDWLCWPRFDSAACFAALLGGEQHGCWSLAPQASRPRVLRRYLQDTLILESDYETTEGAVRLVDFMPVDVQPAALIRVAIGLRGSVPMRMRFAPRFDYGNLAPWMEQAHGHPLDRSLVARGGPNALLLRAPVPLRIQNGEAQAEFLLQAGQRRGFELRHVAAAEPMPAPLCAETLLESTSRHWQRWIGRFELPTPWPVAVRRSLLTLRALIHEPGGALVAAPTTSLPEKSHGRLNYDYRYTWLRDSTFTLTALLNAGYRQEALNWRDWILRTIGGEPAKLRVLYRVDGARDIGEHCIDWLPGYGGASPVRIGNAAAYQHQIDIYGEVIDAMELATRAGIAQSAHGMQVERGIVEHLERVWNDPGEGLWERRGEQRRYTYSQVMAWVGVDRFLRSAARHGHASAARLRHLAALRERIRGEILRSGFDARHGRFVRSYGDSELDASLLLLPLVGFIRADEPRMASTIAAIERELVEDGFVMRQRTQKGQQGAFLACTCWLADCLRLQGRDEEARAALERVLAVSNDVGLLSEEYDPLARRLCGNYPQAFSHLAVVNAALGFAGPLLQRGGG